MTPTAVDMTQVLPVLLPLVWAAILALAVFLYVLLAATISDLACCSRWPRPTGIAMP